MSATAFQRKRRALLTQKVEEQKPDDDLLTKTRNATIEHLKDLKVADLKELAKEKGITGTSKMNQEALIQAIMEVEGRDGGGSESTPKDQE